MIPIGTNLRLKRIPKITIALIVINTILYLADFRGYKFLASVFSHADFFHLFFNMAFLWSFGSYLEDKIGWKRYLIFYFLSHAGCLSLHYTIEDDPVIGASGAISGVMGIYLMRCRYAKIKTMIDPIGTFFISVSINAKWLLGIWFLRDLYDAFFTDDMVAHWGHIGGFLTGIIIGKISKYGTEAKKEHLYERASELVEQRWGLADAEKDLLDALKIAPDNPDIHYQLGRLYSGLSDEREKGKKHYLDAVKLYYHKGKEKSRTGETFLEYLMKYNETLSPELHLKYASTLSNAGDYDGASKILEPLIYRDDLSGHIGERILFNLIKFSTNADLKELAEEGYDRLKKVFPQSTFIKQAEVLMSVKKERKSIHLLKSSDVKEGLNIREKLDELTSEPIFWALWTVSSTISIKLGMAWFKEDTKTFILFLIISVIITFGGTYILQSVSSLFGSIYGMDSRKSQKQALREVNLSFYFDKAVTCEKYGKYDEAVDYYKAVLDEDDKHFEAMFRLARLYQKKMNQPQMAIEEYKKLLKTVSEEHPYSWEAKEGIREISQATLEDSGNLRQ